jgi:Fic-DOC domain mobile mystery protein B
MLGRVWTWAGHPRKSDKNIGVPKERISEELAALFGNAKYWIDNKTYSWDEIATRFHHQLVAVHAFVNGNGRHARLMTDVLLTYIGQEPFSWGRTTLQGALEVESVVRKEYIAALQEADRHDYGRLLRFVRS